MKRLLCKFAHWILDKYEPVDVWKTTVKTNLGVYKVEEIEFNNDYFTDMTIKYKLKKFNLKRF